MNGSGPSTVLGGVKPAAAEYLFSNNAWRIEENGLNWAQTEFRLPPE
jgi:hypothetical protein